MSSHFEFELDRHKAAMQSVPKSSRSGVVESSQVDVSKNGVLRPDYVPERDHLLIGGGARHLPVDGGSKLQIVEDVSHHDNHMTMDQNQYRPRILRDIVDGNPAIRFEPNDSTYLQTWTDWYSQPIHVFVVLHFHRLPWDNSGNRWVFADRKNDLKFGFYSHGNNYINWEIRGNSRLPDDRNEDGTAILDEDRIYIANILFDGDNSHIRINGEIVNQGDITGGSNPYQFAGLSLGGEDNSNNSSVDVLEYLVYPRRMANEQAIENYLDRYSNALDLGPGDEAGAGD